MRIALAWLLFAAPAFGWTLVGQEVKGWNTRTLTVRASGANCPIPEADLFAIIDEAIDAWNGVPIADITLRRDPAATVTTVSEFVNGLAVATPVILCDPSFSLNNSVDPDFVPAAARLGTTEAGGHLRYGGVLLNAEAGTNAEISKLGRPQLVITLAHELGHVLGLGHSQAKESLMFYSISDKTKTILAQDDQDGLAFLYPRNELAAGTFGCAAAKNGEGSPLSLWWIIPVVALHLALRRRLPGRRG